MAHGTDAEAVGRVAGARRPDDADRQGLVHGDRAGSHRARHPGPRRHGLCRGDRRVAQFYRDARIASIYEGTNGIQAIDLVGRKLLRDGGATVAAFVSDMRAVDAPLANAGDELAVVRQALARALDELVQCSTHMLTGERRIRSWSARWRSTT
jgi:hypothetical protein